MPARFSKGVPTSVQTKTWKKEDVILLLREKKRHEADSQSIFFLLQFTTQD